MVSLPIRTCIGCRRKSTKGDLLRFVCDSTGNLRADPKSKLPGRGAYVCYSQTCINAAFKSHKRVNYLLRVSLSKQAVDLFKQELLESV
jgi:predicted RNA-binding protein YlxR (DUF448 family)